MSGTESGYESSELVLMVSVCDVLSLVSSSDPLYPSVSVAQCTVYVICSKYGIHVCMYVCMVILCM